MVYSRQRLYRTRRGKKKMIYYAAKRKLKKQKAAKQSTTQIIRFPTVMPDKTTVKMIYADRITFSGDDDLVQIYRGAGAYTPKVNAGGGVNDGSPNGWKDYKDYYQYYICDSSQIRLQIVSTGAGTNLATAANVLVIPFQLTHQNTPPDVYLLNDEPYAKSKVVGGAGGNTISYLSNYMTYKKIQGKSEKNNLQDDYYAHASTGTVPQDDWYWHVYCSSVGDISLDKVIVYVKITYYVTFYTRKDVVGSGADNTATGYTGGQTGYIVRGQASD